MTVQLTYNLTNPKLSQAVDIANKLLSSPELLDLIRERRTPFVEGTPAGVDGSVVAAAFERSKLRLTVCEYDARKPSIGGMFDPAEKNHIYTNRKAIDGPRQRSINGLARMLIHECVHAVSRENTAHNFSHCGLDSHVGKPHDNTAPYWIQNRLKEVIPIIDDDDEIIEVELFDAEREAAVGQNRRCE